MKLKSAHITDFRSIRDSNEIDVTDVTGLVGKNESGKTAILRALYRLNPIVPDQGTFDVTDDYPRADVEDYQQGIDNGDLQPAVVVSATYVLDDKEVEKIEQAFGAGVLKTREFTVSKSYSNKRTVGVVVDEIKAGNALLAKAGLSEELKGKTWANLSQLEQFLATLAATKTKAFNDAQARVATITDPDEKAAAAAQAQLLQESNAAKQFRTWLDPIVKRGLGLHIWDQYISAQLPVFLYFDEYFQMEGHLNIDALKERQASNQLLDSDRPMLGLIELARLDLDQLVSPDRTEALISKLEGASNFLSKQVLKYWSQNKHLSVKFDVRPARPGDPVGMRSGTNLWGRVHDSVHLVSTPLGSRSKGFVWFFSFLAWFSQQKKLQKPMILLLDEPGLVLHGTAQKDLLRYIEEELKPHHQVIYTTHSPFMVDAGRFDRIRIVEDRSMLAEEELPLEERGTKVYVDVLSVDEGSLFPLQGALGYELAQTLFVGPNCLVVEGPSDLLYLQVLKAWLEGKHQTTLSDEWTITPVGGSDKVPTFVALLGAQKGLKIATLIDIQHKDRQKIENLYKSKLLKKKHVITFADFTGESEADIEDMFEVPFYLKLVNAEYAQVLKTPIQEADLNLQGGRRILAAIEEHLEKHPLKKNEKFSHYRPARYFFEQAASLTSELSPATVKRFEEAFKIINALL
jgi:predicted ATP-dependent endonuclease of OLD family